MFEQIPEYLRKSTKLLESRTNIRIRGWKNAIRLNWIALRLNRIANMRFNNQNENLNISSWYYSYSTFRTRIIILSKKYSFRTFINSSNSATVPETGLKMRLGVLSSYFWSRTIQKRRIFGRKFRYRQTFSILHTEASSSPW